MSDPPIGVVALLIDPACCYRTAPCPPQLGEGMTGSRNSPALPQRICTTTALEKAQQPNTTQPIFRRPPKACIGTVRRQDRSSSLRCGRSVLTPGPYPMPSARRPKASKTPGRQRLDRTPPLQG